MTAGRHAGATLAVLLGLCAIALFLGLRAVSQPFGEVELVEEAAPVCELRDLESGTPVATDEVTVSVYNAGGQSGAASRTLQGLIERGFGAGESGNIDAKVQFVQIWADDKDNPAARLVAAQFGPRTKIATNRDLPGLGVVVVIGPRLGDLADEAPDSVTATEPSTICSPPVT